VLAQRGANAQPASPPPAPTRWPAETAGAAASSQPADEAKRACVECVNALVVGGCYVRTATLAGWGLCLTCTGGGVEPEDRFIEKNRCPMCANVRWSLCDFKPGPKNCVPNCCPGTLEATVSPRYIDRPKRAP
jgi:hypothetical protein